MSPVRQLVSVRRPRSKSIQLRSGPASSRRSGWPSRAPHRNHRPDLGHGRNSLPRDVRADRHPQQNLEDSAFDLEAEIRAEAEEQFALAEGTAVVTGNGVGKPLGWPERRATSTNSGTATTVADAGGQANGLVTLFHSLKTAYTRNASWAMNRSHPRLGPQAAGHHQAVHLDARPRARQPNTILGAPYVEIPDMPNEGANTYPIAFGDFSRAYTLVDRIAMTMLRDPFTQAASGNIRFMFRRRLGGQVGAGEAITQLKCST